MSKLSIVIPVYNEASSVLEVLRSLEKLPIDKEIIVVDDGSTDGSRDILEKYQKSNPEYDLKRLKDPYSYYPNLLF